MAQRGGEKTCCIVLSMSVYLEETCLRCEFGCGLQIRLVASSTPMSICSVLLLAAYFEAFFSFERFNWWDS